MENINALNEISKGASMGVDAISYIIDKVDDEKFKKLLSNQKSFYEEIKCDIMDLFSRYDSEEIPSDTTTLNKAMTWSSINMKTLKDHSPSKIAELLLNGTNMGIIEGRKILNNKDIDESVEKIIDRFVKEQERFVESLKDFL